MLFGRKRNRKLTYEEARQILIEQDDEFGELLKWTTVPKQRVQMSLFECVSAKMRKWVTTMLA